MLNRALSLCCVVGWILPSIGAAAPVEVRSPDGQVVLTLDVIDGGKPVYRVAYKGKPVVNDSPLGLAFGPNDGGAFTSGLSMGEVERGSGDETYPLVAGKSATARDHFNSAAVPLKRGDTTVHVILRAYDDGVAFQYRLPERAGSTARIALASEESTFNVPGDATAWVLSVPNFTSHYEYNYEPKKVAEIEPGKLIGLPLLLELPDGGPALAIAESNVVDYAGMYLSRADGKSTSLQSRLSPLPGEPAVAVKAKPGAKTPWRIIQVGDSAGKLLESNIVMHLNDPNSIADTSWIKPGKVLFLWWNGHLVGRNGKRGAVDTKTVSHYVDGAADLGFPYSSIDGLDIAWYGGVIPGYTGQDITKSVPELDLPAVFERAKKKNVRIRLWMASQALRAHDLDRVFSTYAKWGVEGIMVDFIERDDQEMNNWVREMVAKAAQYKLTVTLHNVAKPTGLSRTYPNLLSFEAVRNQEWNKWDPVGVTPEHNLIVPFTRMLAGPLDYHSGGFRSVRTADYIPRDVAPDVMGTRCHQLATYVVYENPMPMAVDYPAAYKNRPGIDFLRDVPTTWDETRFIDGKVGDHITVARRKGKEWFVGVMTDDTPRELKVPLTFLGEGKFTAEIWADDAAGGPNAVRKDKRDVTATDSLSASLAPAGGQVIRITPIAK